MIDGTVYKSQTEYNKGFAIGLIIVGAMLYFFDFRWIGIAMCIFGILGFAGSFMQQGKKTEKKSR